MARPRQPAGPGGAPDGPAPGAAVPSDPLSVDSLSADPVSAGAAGLSWRDRWLAWRDRLLASPRFQTWAAAFPPTRPLARRRAAQLFDLCAGFVYSQVLLACVRLKLFDKLAEGPQSLGALAPRLALSEARAARLLEAAVALKLVQRRSGGRYGLGPHGAALRGNGGVAEMIEHHALLYADLADPLALLRDEAGPTRLRRFWAYAGRDGARTESLRGDATESDASQAGAAGGEAGPAAPLTLSAAEVAGYSALMAASQAMIAEEVLGAYPLGRHRCLLDVGGGEGRFLRAAGARWPGLQLRLFDLPPVAARAAAAFAAAGLAERAEAQGGDFRREPLPRGADLISLVRIVHDHDDAAALALLRAVHAALPDGGRLLLAEPMSGTPGAEPAGAAYFGFYLLAMGSGRPRSPAELQALLRAAGFRRSRLLATRRPMLARVLLAEA